MTLSIALELALKSVLVTAGVLLALNLLRARSAAERSWLAHFGLAAALVVPLLGELLPRWYLARPVDISADSKAILADHVNAGGAVLPVSAGPLENAYPAWDSAVLAAMAYALPAVVLLSLTIIAILRLFALRRRSAVLVDAPWLTALAHAQRRMGFKNGAALLVSPELVSPVSWGLFRPTILVGEAASTGRDDAEAIIAHELAHVARLDWLKLLLARAVTAVLWFNPFIWLLARCCHQLREEAADDAVLCSDINGAAYAQLLVSAARHESRGLFLAANGVAPSRASLGDRVRRALDTSTARTPARLWWSTGCVAIGMAIGAPLAALTARAMPVEPVMSARVVTQVRSTTTVTGTPDRAQAVPPVMARPLAVPVTAKASPRPPAVPKAGAVPPARYAGLSTNELMQLDAVGAGPEWILEMRALGYHDASSGSMMAMAVQDVTPAYVRQLAAVGYTGIPASQLTLMRIHDVTPQFVARVVRRWGFRPDVKDLIQMKLTGFDTPREPPEPPHPPAKSRSTDP